MVKEGRHDDVSDLEGATSKQEVIRDEISRRRLLGRGAAGALSVSALAYLAACGTDEPAAAATRPRSRS